MTAPNRLSQDVLDATDAVVLVGGKGTRLRPLTLSAPKPMLPTAGLPFLTHLLSRIKDAGIKHIVLGTSYKAEVFSDYFGDGSEFGLEIEYVVEEQPLDTGGGIRNVLPKLRGDNIMVFNGDVLGGTELQDILATFVTKQADVVLHLVRVADPRAFGCVPTDDDGRVQAFLEKTPNPPTDQINAGCYVFRREIIESIPAGVPVSVERDVFPHLLETDCRMYGHVDSHYWRDMGTPQDFMQGSADLVQGIAPSPALEGHQGDYLVLPGADVAETASLQQGTVVGQGAVVGHNDVVTSSVLFDGAVLGDDVVIERSLIGNGAHIGNGCVVRDAVIGDDAIIGDRCELLDGIRVWPGIEIPDAAIRFSTDA
ncbi:MULTISPECIES: NDP-sugar synthase [Lawsonella]|jgi:nucleotidyl transferase|uniref:GDP-mannose pyrophosphorylase n=1 Tax=Lawsonella clevelandensis TaxID=1528099 RepID=A0A2W5K367_9ACTN|nr:MULTISPECIES: NDP-sugar synthase [Lawsonella]PZP89266.1 MAG: GDP-mannose pyrophosphorylase [Lawsonella clevelandensis]GHT85558.1 putative sugar-phosphate nucleotidyl transferase [Actinomycetota bacterium]